MHKHEYTQTNDKTYAVREALRQIDIHADTYIQNNQIVIHANNQEHTHTQSDILIGTQGDRHKQTNGQTYRQNTDMRRHANTQADRATNIHNDINRQPNIQAHTHGHAYICIQTQWLPNKKNQTHKKKEHVHKQIGRTTNTHTDTNA